MTRAQQQWITDEIAKAERLDDARWAGIMNASPLHKRHLERTAQRRAENRRALSVLALFVAAFVAVTAGLLQLI